MKRLLWCFVVAALVVGGCGGDPGGEDKIVDGSAEPDRPLVGTWTAMGTDEDFGAVEVVMELRGDGTLSMSVAMQGGGQLTFPGTWTVEGSELVLEGEYFRPDKRSQVRWSLRDDGVLVLEDDSGESEEWMKLEA